MPDETAPEGRDPGEDPDALADMPSAVLPGVSAGLLPDLAIMIPEPAWTEHVPDAEHICATSAAAVIGTPERVTELAIVLSSDEEVRRLNREYRGKDRPTNVLSFPSGLASGAGETDMLGDVILAFGTVSMEAARDGKSLDAHLRHLVVHGVLHLLGHDHDNEHDAAAMEEREIGILAAFGVSDPYAPVPE